MNKTVSITIGGSIFYIEEDAFNRLDKIAVFEMFHCCAVT